MQTSTSVQLVITNNPVLLSSTKLNKKAQLSLTNPRDAKACQKRRAYNVTLTILAYLHSLAVVASEMCEIPRNSLKIQTYGVQGHRSWCQRKAHM